MAEGPSSSESASSRHVWVDRFAWVVVALSCAQILLFAHGRDQGIYSVVAETVLRGGMPYRDAWDFKPPGIFVVFTFAEALFGKSMASIRIMEVAGLVGSVFAYRSIARNVFGSALAGTVGGALAALIHAQLEFWHTAQPESFGGMITAFAVALVVGRGTMEARPVRVRAWLAAGGLFGAAFLLKPPLGGAAIPCAIYLAATELRHTKGPLHIAAPPLVMGAASLVPLLACGLWFQVSGAWPALSWTLFEFTPGYTRLGWNYSLTSLLWYGLVQAVTYFSYAVPVGLAAAVVLPRLHARERGAVALIAGIAFVQVVGVALQAKFFQYHYGATLPLLSLIAGVGFAKVWGYTQRVPSLRAPGAAAFAVGLALLVQARTATPQVPGTFWGRSAERLAFAFFRSEPRNDLDARLYRAADYDIGADRAMARELARATAPDDAVFVWGFEPIVYWFAGRRPASRYVYNVPQRALWERERARADLLADLAAAPPRAVVVQHGDYFNFVTGDDLDSAAALPTFPELARLLQARYVRAMSVDRLDLLLER